jgi:hypothetical protein
MDVPVEGYPNYTVDEQGNVFSKFVNRYLIKSIQRNGYETVELFNDSGSKRLLVHRLVAKAFIPNPDQLPCVNHKNEIRSDNRASNLEWCTHKYNSNYGHCQERIRANRNTKTPGMARFHEAGARAAMRAVTNLDTGETFDAARHAAKHYGINDSHIGEVCKGKRKTAGGFHWSYKKEGDDLSVRVF